METGSWTFACQHCEEPLRDDSHYQSPVCLECGYHVHPECTVKCPESEEGWHFICGHCTETLPPQGPGQQSPTCDHCHYHVHRACRTVCPEELAFEPLTTEYKIVPSTKSLTTRETRALAELYPSETSENNRAYRRLVAGLGCVFLNDVSYRRLSCGDGLAWLNPYTGNQHNRCVFVQLVLAALSRDSVSRQFGRRLFEAFLGSGQVFMNFSWCEGLFGNEQLRVVAGDLNVCLCCAWRGLTGQLTSLRRFLLGYLDSATRRDKELSESLDPGAVYLRLKNKLNNLIAALGDVQLEDCEPDDLIKIAYLYIYLNNRCANQATYNLNTGTFSVSLDKAKLTRLDELRRSEWNALCHAGTLASRMELQFCHGDFAQTTKSASLGDLVVYDCPFPEFSIAIPGNLESDFNLVVGGGTFDVGVDQALAQCAKQTNMKGGGHYGGDEGGSLQLRILRDAVGRVRSSASVVICNYATPTLLVWYSKLSMALYFENVPIFLFKRPQTGDQLYCLAIWPSDAVLARTKKRASEYVRERILAVYKLIGAAMEDRSEVSRLEVKSILDKCWK
jgi:site-specific DNA-adenine methylase